MIITLSPVKLSEGDPKIMPEDFLRAGVRLERLQVDAFSRSTLA